MKLFFTIAAISFAAVSFSQDIPNIKFGKIDEAVFKNRSYPIDTGAAAVVLADIGSTQVKGNSKGSVSLEFRYFRRIQILKKSAYDKATVQIPLYTDGEFEENLSDIKAVTYNLENGKIVESKLNPKSSVFREKINKNRVIKKFTLPNVKEGSVLEIEYKLTSDFLFNIQPWAFQSDIPHLWSQYTVTIPQFLDYMVITQSDLPFYLNEQKQRQGNFMVEIPKEVYKGVTATDRVDITCAVADFRWAIKDVPAFREEAYTTSPDNYVAKLEFQLAGFLPPFTERKVMTTWPDLTTQLLKRADFGGQLVNNDSWLPDLVKKTVAGAATQEERARKIYENIRDHITCTSYNQLLVEVSLEKAVKNNNGGVAEINLLLTAMLRHAGIKAEPVILSTRGHAFVLEEYPVVMPFNYVICKATVDGKELFLDASRPRFGFGKLHYDCYNGQARVVNEAATLVNLGADQLKEREQTSLFLYKEKGGKWTGYANKQYGYFASDLLRQKMGSSGNRALQNELTAGYGGELTIDSLEIGSLSNFDEPLTAQYIIRNETDAEDIIYFNPVLGDRIKENPFKSAERKYPVEMPYTINELYTLSMEIPDGYLVDELPKSVNLLLNPKKEGVFEYTISKSTTHVTLNYKLELNRAVFFPAEYNLLREFYKSVVGKLEEQVVFKKKP